MLLSTGVNSISAYAEVDTETPTATTLIAPGFLLHLTCAEDVKLNGDFRVMSTGQIRLPYKITLKAAGMKLPAFRAVLEKTYRPYFRGKPDIQVTVKQVRYSIKILGVVKNPGDYLVDGRTTLGEALAMAAVRTEDLPIGFARFTQGERSYWVSMEDYLKGDSENDLPAWKGGERIHFQLERPESGLGNTESRGEDTLGPSARKVQVLGEVRNPGGVSFRNKKDGYYYLIQRGGPTQYSNLGNVELLRSDLVTGERRTIMSGSIQDINDVRESDILIINPERPSKFEHVLQNSALIATIISSIVLTLYVAKK